MVIWIALLIIFSLLLEFNYYEESPWIKPTPGNLRVFSPEKDTFVLWDRKEVISFSLTQITTSINYLFVGAAAILGFAVSLLIGREKQAKTVPRESAVLLKHAAVGCLLSMFFGYTALSSFLNLADSESFSVYDDIGPGAACQALTLLISVLILVLAAHFIVRGRSCLPPGAGNRPGER